MNLLSWTPLGAEGRKFGTASLVKKSIRLDNLQPRSGLRHTKGRRSQTTHGEIARIARCPSQHEPAARPGWHSTSSVYSLLHISGQDGVPKICRVPPSVLEWTSASGQVTQASRLAKQLGWAWLALAPATKESRPRQTRRASSSAASCRRPAFPNISDRRFGYLSEPARSLEFARVSDGVIRPAQRCQIAGDPSRVESSVPKASNRP